MFSIYIYVWHVVICMFFRALIFTLYLWFVFNYRCIFHRSPSIAILAQAINTVMCCGIIQVSKYLVLMYLSLQKQTKVNE